MNIEDKKQIITAIGFSPVEGEVNKYIKHYPDFKYDITVDLDKGDIHYPSPITIENNTTTNLHNPENLVVLECVNRLLEKGYLPKAITLEKTFKLGHKNSGRLDISVKDKENNTFLMIECKTAGIEFEKEIKNTSRNGGQLFSYFQQDKNAKFLCLYASELKSGRIEYQSKIIECTTALSEAKEVKDIFKIWNKQFKDNGLFEQDITAYNFKPVALRIRDLKPLQEDDSGKIFNGFMEILRHNVISDKPNAFNKIFNLFLCKLQDEKGLNESEAQFQWREDDTNISFLMRINELYAKGVKGYLGKEITNLTEKDINNLVTNAGNEQAANRIREAILYKNNEFAFSDVYDERSFTQNAKVVREIVELLQTYKIRYAHRQQFLGDFFELLLNTGFKQESGQFFTPVPLARFIINSLPIKQIIQEKLDNQETDFLPYLIDYAMGTGHFITEAMDEIQEIINSGKFDPKDRDSIAKIDTYKNENAQFNWAEQYIYGIERDYRLVKTAKVACFLHGDGLANIIHGDGLDSFTESLDYKGILQGKGKYKDNQQFDILVANPPYSVSAFKNTLPNGENSFDLYRHLTDQSSEIECLFIERTKQLVKAGGCAAIILPSSILSNAGIYAKARKILLKHFEIYAISEFGSNTFMATGTNTVVLFMKRRDDTTFRNIETIIEQFLTNYRDVTCNGLENAFSKFVKTAYDLDFDVYTQSLKDNERDLDLEKEKLFYFMLNANVKTIVTKSGEKKIEKSFLGYEFSNRRGHEGIKIYKDEEGKPINKLYNASDRHDENRVSHYIYERGLGNTGLEAAESLTEHLFEIDLCDLIMFEDATFEASISLSLKGNFEGRKSKYNLKKLGGIVTIKIGGTPSRQKSEYYINGSFLWVSIADLHSKIITNTKEKINEKGIKNSNVKLIPKNTVLISFKLSMGKVSISGKPLYTNEAIAGLIVKDDTILNYQFLYYIFQTNSVNLTKNTANAFGKSLNSKDLANIEIPLPPINIQNDIVRLIVNIEDKIKILHKSFDSSQEKIMNGFRAIYDQATDEIKIGDKSFFNIQIGKRVLRTQITDSGLYPVYSANVHEPFGFINELSFNDFEDSSLIWGIDGNWEVNTIQKGTPFVPTDHCGVLRIKKLDFCHILYVAYALKVKGHEENFSRNKRASLKKISEIKIPVPPLEKQKEIVAKIQKREAIIKKNKIKIKELEAQKQAIIDEIWEN